VTWQATSVPSLAADLEFRGLVHQVTDADLLRRLDGPDRVTAYIGFDPTANSLHVGHLVQVLLLRRLQASGHRVLAVAGGATGLIGDPGGKRQERPLLSPDEVKANVAAITEQIGRLLDLGPDAVVLDNASWIGRMDVIGFLRDVGKHFTVNQMIAKESVRTRLERPEHSISYTEFSYMLLQAYDFLHLFDTEGCRLQLGASDQWGNITMGVELIRKCRDVQAWGLTTPLMVRPDGTKFGKTEGGTVWLDPERTSPYTLYQFFLRTEDAEVGGHLRRLTFLDRSEIEELEQATRERPAERSAQRALARSVCALVHGDDEVRRVERAAAALYGEDVADLDEATLLQASAEAPTSTWSRSDLDSGMTIVDALVRSGLVASRSQARTTVAQGGAYVNNRRVIDPEAPLSRSDLLHDRYLLLRRGRRQMHLVRVA
jgi:tyrosyl-tRNA synthetase